jgi:hypothetical protein
MSAKQRRTRLSDVSFAGVRQALDVLAFRDRERGLLLGEAEHRLEQLDVLLVDIDEAIARYHSKSSHGPRDHDAVRVKAYTEAFYYFAHRAVDVLELVFGTDSVKRAPGKKLIGIVEVRNCLIEHAHKKRGVMPITWLFDEFERGVVLKPFGGGEFRTVFDVGLYGNALELRTQIERLLNRGNSQT